MDPIAAMDPELRESLVKLVLKGLETAQSVVKGPEVYYVDLKRHVMPLFEEHKRTEPKASGVNHITLEALLVHMYTSDLFYANPDFSLYFLSDPGSPFSLWSEALKTRFEGCTFDSINKVFTGGPTLHFTELTKELLSHSPLTDAGHPKFLDGTVLVPKVLYASFMQLRLTQTHNKSCTTTKTRSGTSM